MSDPSKHPRLTFPSPTLILGVGRFGLAVLERLGEDWEELQETTEDPSLENVRLLHVCSEPNVPDTRWRKGEQQYIQIARHTGEGDLPTLALNFVILRSMGLIRYRNGRYQLAVPRDDGVAELLVQAGVEQLQDNSTPREVPADFARRRYFVWQNLSPDPLTAVERLRVLQSKQPEVDLFVTPLVNRVRHGHSPQAVINCISRCNALAQGRDPTPFAWLAQLLAEDEAHAHADDDVARLRFEPSWVFTRFPRQRRHHPDLAAAAAFCDAELALAQVAPPPLRDGSEEEEGTSWYGQWSKSVAKRFARSITHHTSTAPDNPLVASFEALNEALTAGEGVLRKMDAGAGIVVPPVFHVHPGDLTAPISPFDLLRIDWEATGWATLESSGNLIEFQPLHVSDFRLGLFDHDRLADTLEARTERARFAERLRELAVQAHRGLVRMWVDLQRERVDSPDNDELAADRYRDTVDEAVAQTLEVLGELLVRPLLADPDSVPTTQQPLARVFEELPATPSGELRANLIGEDAKVGASVRDLLDARLATLGYHTALPDTRRRLFHETAVSPEEIAATTTGDAASVKELLPFRAKLNELVRELYDFTFLRRYHNRPKETAPRLSIYIVVDISEPFGRVLARPLLRTIHAELLRSFGPLFQTYREGFDRTLTVTPIFWMPHPADSYSGRFPAETHAEEAAIIESVQSVRRWAESVPRGKRCIPQIFVNSRVTDSAVLSVWDSVRQTRDFLTFQLRNDVAADAWLRHTVTGPRGEEMLSTFACHAIDFPAERAREYLANRLARHGLRRIRKKDKGKDPATPIDEEALKPRDEDEVTAAARERVAARTRPAADRLQRGIEDRIGASARTRFDEVESAFDEAYVNELSDLVQKQWWELTRRRGDMDDVVEKLRQAGSVAVRKSLKELENAGDKLITEYANKGGVNLAYRGFERLEQLSNESLQAAEQQRLDGEDLCRDHGIPAPYPVFESGCEAIVDAGRKKPEFEAMVVGALLWAVLTPVLGAPIFWLIALAAGLNRQQNVAELIVGYGAPVLGALLLTVPVVLLLRAHMNEHVEALQERIAALAREAARVVHAHRNPLREPPSIRSFMEARLRHAAALAARNFARQIYEDALKDLQLAQRLQRSLKVQQDVLIRHAENLGVQLRMTGLDEEEMIEDVERLFDGRTPAPNDRLIDPEGLLIYYEREVGNDERVDELVEELIQAAGGFDAWRHTASFADTAQLLRYTRTKFDTLVSDPVADQFGFQDVVRHRFVQFVSSSHTNIGFGAKFTGYEGLAPTNITVLARGELVVPNGLDQLFEDARTAPDAPRGMKAVKVRKLPIDPNTAFIISIAQGIQPYSLRNLRRFESFHLRKQQVDDHVFLADDARGARPINHLSGFENVSERIHRQLKAADLGRAVDEDRDG